MERRLYLHEVVDVVGRGAAPYMAHVVGFDPGTVADRGLALAGTWEVVGTTGRWPQVVNLWDVVDGWEGWTRLTRRTNLAKAGNTELAGWWDEAYKSRTGGFDRLLVSAPGAPDPMEAAASGVRGEVAVHELTRVQPGAGSDYLAAVVDRWAPAAAEVGVHLVGAFEVLMTDVEVVTVWAASLDAHTAMLEAGVDGPAVLPGFAESRRQWCTAWREELMVPGPGSPFHPGT
ncbi:NIPSNAP family containing protein [Iamia sp. SCSIO 61187]|uniref:hypothetical protein n=1 Tax=Iamia sp. SCSIO 61187 TaxID=2722752 RepID=UPI001C636982|nr:hypothetical protein [Iamia sp. SCSIO 61187]QYG94144.1 NIPSNAP family containing protein [Iamia sp. SCSIO 61187]